MRFLCTSICVMNCFCNYKKQTLNKMHKKMRTTQEKCFHILTTSIMFFVLSFEYYGSVNIISCG